MVVLRAVSYERGTPVFARQRTWEVKAPMAAESRAMGSPTPSHLSLSLARSLARSRARSLSLSHTHDLHTRDREFFIGNLLVRIHCNIVMIRWTGLAPWEFEFPFPGSLTSTVHAHTHQKLLHSWIILVIVKRHLVQIGRIDGPTDYL